MGPDDGGGGRGGGGRRGGIGGGRDGHGGGVSEAPTNSRPARPAPPALTDALGVLSPLSLLFYHLPPPLAITRGRRRPSVTLALPSPASLSFSVNADSYGG